MGIETGIFLSLLHGRQWDAGIDACGYLPRVVLRSAALLRDAVHRYLFVSSISVYADGSGPGQDERSARAALPSADCADIPAHYGALKAACGDAVLAQFGERLLLLRPWLIVGPFDPTGRFTYWMQRVARGGSCWLPTRLGIRCN
jgi:2'-hydroxyisoflavone reductase